MPIYFYIALNDQTRKIKGELIAANEMDLEERLKAVGLDLIDYKESKKKKKSGGKVTLKDMIILCLHLEQLDRAGVPLLEALADVRDSTESPKLRDILTDVYEDVKNGEVLSQALSKHPKVFNNVFVGLIKTGEKTGNLSDSFHHISGHIKWVAELRRKVRKALGYPIALCIVIIAVVSILMTQVVPKLVSFITSQGFELPIHTKALIAFSDAFVNYWYLFLGIPVVSIVTIAVMYKVSENFAYMMDSFMLKAPVIGKTVRKIDMARFTHFFSVMFRSGIDILESLATAQTVVANRVLAESVVLVRRFVSEGNSLTNALRSSNQFPTLVVRMFKVGEDSGNMNDALENINFFYEREVNDAVDGMVALIQPALTVVLGLMILWIVSAIFGPLYDSFSKMNF